MVNNRDEHSEVLVSVLIGTRNRPHALSRCLESVLVQDYPDFEIVILDDGSEQNIAALVGERFPDPRIRWLRSERRLGVAGGRNRLIEDAQGSILVSIDDDAILGDSSSISHIVEHFRSMPQVGVLAFKIVTHLQNSTELWLPFSRRNLQKHPQFSDRPRLVSYYIGTGHAIRREVFNRCGLYQDDLVYYGEDLELSYRVIQSGIPILYAPDLVLDHFPEPSALKPQGEREEMRFAVCNRIWMAWKHLPQRYLWPHLAIWLTFYGVTALRRRQLRQFWQGACVGFVGLRRLQRQVLNKEAIAYLKVNFGRLWY